MLLRATDLITKIDSCTNNQYVHAPRYSSTQFSNIQDGEKSGIPRDKGVTTSSNRREGSDVDPSNMTDQKTRKAMTSVAQSDSSKVAPP